MDSCAAAALCRRYICAAQAAPPLLDRSLPPFVPQRFGDGSIVRCVRGDHARRCDTRQWATPDSRGGVLARLQLLLPLLLPLLSMLQDAAEDAATLGRELRSAALHVWLTPISPSLCRLAPAPAAASALLLLSTGEA